MGNTDNNQILSLSRLCVKGITLFDGTVLTDINTNLSYGLFIHFELDEKKMEKSIQSLYNSIDAYRAVMKRDNNSWEYHYEKEYQYHIRVESVEGESLEEKQEKVKSIVRENTLKPSSLENEIPARFDIYKLEENEYFLAVYLNHYIADGHSIGLTIWKIMEKYWDITIEGARSVGNMRKYCQRIFSADQDERSRRCIDYWKNEMNGYHIDKYQVNQSDLPAYDGLPHCIKMDKKNIVAFAQQNKTTVSNMVMLAYHITLAKVFGQRDNVISFVSTDRNTPDDWGLIAPYEKLLSNRFILEEGKPYRELLKIIAGKIGRNIAHKYVPMQRIGLSRYGVTYMNHSKKLFESDEITTWMPELLMDYAKCSFIVLRAQELAETIEIDVVCNKEYINRKDYEKVVKVLEDTIMDMIDNSDKEVEI